MFGDFSDMVYSCHRRFPWTSVFPENYPNLTGSTRVTAESSAFCSEHASLVVHSSGPPLEQGAIELERSWRRWSAITLDSRQRKSMNKSHNVTHKLHIEDHRRFHLISLWWKSMVKPCQAWNFDNMMVVNGGSIPSLVCVFLRMLFPSPVWADCVNERSSFALAVCKWIDWIDLRLEHVGM